MKLAHASDALCMAIPATGVPSPAHTAAPSNSSDVYRLCTIGELPSRPVEYLIDQLLPAASLAEIHGPPGVGKSFVSLGSGLAVGHGVPFLGRTTDQGYVAYIAAERFDLMRPRVDAWLAREGLRSGGTNCRFLDEAPQLIKSRHVDKLLRTFHALDRMPRLIVIDTLSRCLLGVDENQAREMTRVVAALERIRCETKACVLIVHHTRKSGDVERGSTVLRGAADVMLGLKRIRGQLTLSLEKANDIPWFPDIPIRLERVAGSCVVSVEENVVNAEADKIANSDVSLALDTIRQHPNGLSLRQWADESGVARSNLSRWCKHAPPDGFAGLVTKTKTGFIPVDVGVGGVAVPQAG